MNSAARRKKKKKENGARVGSYMHKARAQRAAAAAAASEENVATARAFMEGQRTERWANDGDDDVTRKVQKQLNH